MNKPTHWVIEGIDRLGKGSLINGIQNKFGYHFTIHYQKPEKLECYDNNLKRYQYTSFLSGFNLLNTPLPTIFDRFHLGENVYSHRYRGYSGDYVFQMEELYRTNPDNGNQSAAMSSTRLILLMTSDFSFLEDDGLSFDFTRKEEEQYDFIDAFHRSVFPDKRIIDVSNGNGGYKPFTDILNEVINN